MTPSERVDSPAGARSIGRVPSTGLPAPALGLRLLALAAVAGSAAFLPGLSPRSSLSLTAGILIGALIGLAQYAADRWRPTLPGEPFVVAQIGVWSFLMFASGGQRSPLFLGLLLEVPLAAALMSRRGIVLAAAAGGAAYLGLAAGLDPPLDRSRALVALGFLAVTAALAWRLAEVLERQRRELDRSHAALHVRAQTLAEELRLLGDYLNGGLLVLDELGRVVSLNRAGAKLLGIAEPDAPGRAWQDVLRPDPEGACAVLDTLADGESRRGVQMVLEGECGRRVGVECELWVSPSSTGRRVFVLLGLPMPGGGDGDPLRRLGEAVACVSHQIKNSLHALQGFAGEIEQELSAGSVGHSTRDFVRALHSLGHLADDVLAMSGAPRPAGECVPVAEMLSTAIVLARHPAVRVQIGVLPPALTVCGHRGQLVHALFNLIDNACRVSPAGGVVGVEIAERQGMVIVEILDRGPGLPAGIERLDSRAPSSNGSGYGVLAARRFIEANGGCLTFERRDGGGTLSRLALRAPAHELREV